MFAGVRCRGRERAAGQSSARSGPAEFVEALVVDSEVVGDFVDHGDADFFDDVFFGFADREDFPPVDEDLVWQHSAVAVAPFGERHSFVQAKQPGSGGSSARVMTTLSMYAVSSGGMESRASATSSSKRRREVSITSRIVRHEGKGSERARGSDVREHW